MGRRVLPFFFLLLASVAGAGSPVTESMDARALGMGGAYRSLAATSAAARLNPAALSVERGFFGAASYLTRETDALDAVQVTLVDNITSLIGGAIQYLHFQGEEEREEISLSLSSGHRGEASGLWWGVTGRYVQARERGSQDHEDLLTGDVGFLFERPGGLRIAFVAYDLLDTSSTFLSKRVALGVSRTSPAGWAVSADAVRNLDRDVGAGVDLHVGGQYRFAGTDWTARGGYEWIGEEGRDYGSLGVGWSAPGGWTFAYAVQRSRQSPIEFLNALSAEGSF